MAARRAGQERVSQKRTGKKQCTISHKAVLTSTPKSAGARGIPTTEASTRAIVLSGGTEDPAVGDSWLGTRGTAEGDVRPSEIDLIHQDPGPEVPIGSEYKLGPVWWLGLGKRRSSDEMGPCRSSHAEHWQRPWWLS